MKTMITCLCFAFALVGCATDDEPSPPTCAFDDAATDSGLPMCDALCEVDEIYCLCTAEGAFCGCRRMPCIAHGYCGCE